MNADARDASTTADADGTLRLAVVVLNYRTPALVVDCLETLAEQVEPGRERVVVVDNRSGDDSVPRIRAAIRERGWEDRVLLHESPDNDGFSAGNNEGVRAVRAEAYLLMNSDTLARPGALAELRRALEELPDVDLIAPRLEWPDGTPQRSTFTFHTPLSELERAAGTGPISRLLRRRVVARPPADAPTTFDWASFAAILIRRRAFERVGLMDEGYFLYYEDVDFCRRARAAGLRTSSWPAARIVHLRGGSGPVKESMARRARPPRYLYASRSRYFAKFFGGRLGLLRANLAWLAGRAVSKAREAFGRKQPHLCEREARDLWTGFRRPVEPEEHWKGDLE